MEEGHQLHVSATVLMQALCSEACSSNDLAAKNNPGPRRRVAPVGIGAPERPGMSQPAHGRVRHRHVQPPITQPFPRCWFFSTWFSREEASLWAVTIPPHAWVSGSGSPGPRFPVAFVSRWDNECNATAGAGADDRMEHSGESPTGIAQDLAVSPRCDPMTSPIGPSLGGERRDSTSQSPQMVADTGTCLGPTESVDWHIRQCRSRVVKDGDKSRAYCY